MDCALTGEIGDKEAMWLLRSLRKGSRINRPGGRSRELARSERSGTSLPCGVLSHMHPTITHTVLSMGSYKDQQAILLIGFLSATTRKATEPQPGGIIHPKIK